MAQKITKTHPKKNNSLTITFQYYSHILSHDYPIKKHKHSPMTVMGASILRAGTSFEPSQLNMTETREIGRNHWI